MTVWWEALCWWEAWGPGPLGPLKSVPASRSSAIPLVCGVPHDSALGPVLFILYVADLAAVISQHGLSPHQYANDTQIYGSCSPTDVHTFRTPAKDAATAVDRLSTCVTDINDWMTASRLRLNPTKTQIMWLAQASSWTRLL